MSYPRAPSLHLAKPVNKPFISHRPKTELVSSAPMNESKQLIQKSNLQNSNPEGQERKSKTISRERTYGDRRKVKDISDPEEEDVDETKDVSPPSKPEPSFIPPTECGVDFSEFKTMLEQRRSTLPFSVSTSSFESPDSVTGSSNGCGEVYFEEPPEFDIDILKSCRPSPRTCKFCRKKIPSNFTESPPTATRARIGYCQRHENASILQDGKARGFPTSFDFQTVRSRIIRLIPNVRKMISRRKESEFLIDIRAKTSRRNAAAPMTMMTLFEDAQPGYYGPRGSELISEIVMKRLGDKIRNRESLLESLKFCGGVMGYISAIIVPEVGTLLIMDDIDVERTEAKKIMRESVSYGNVVNPSIDVISSDEGDDSDADLDSD